MAGMKLTRRELAAALVSAAASSAAQVGEPPMEELAKAAVAVRQVKLTYDVEPAFVFRPQ